MNTPPPKTIGSDGTNFRCPTCRNFLPNTSLPSFPFCSDRCRLVDLNNWLEGKYTVSRPIDPTDQLDDLPRAPGTPDPPPDSRP
jgi:endogenous inhibitor of DNA gyrase (YacG/DUF329 family)